MPEHIVGILAATGFGVTESSSKRGVCWNHIAKVAAVAPATQLELATDRRAAGAQVSFEKENLMLQMALLFLVVALIAGALGVANVAFISAEIAWILFVVFLILFLVSLVFGRRTGPPV